ncbi:MAG: hypothetical protein JXD21_04640 [Candidatus Omnitrophica bacterium]|nr:hypothetical protein [Candidatus Omnitrophota bacterium]
MSSKVSKSIPIGWVVPKLLPYPMVMASTRLRVYDVIRYLRENGLATESYRPWGGYKVVIFQKCFHKKAIRLAQKLRKKNIKVVLDINVNYIDGDPAFVTDEHRKNILDMLSVCDAVITPSQYLRDLYARHHHFCFLIEEIIEDRFLSVRKMHNDIQKVMVIFCGYAIKAREVYMIGDLIRSLYQRRKIEFTCICEKDPRLQDVPYQFVRYNHKRLPQLLLKGDIKISPRDMERKYNLGHTFTRIGYPMAVGLPVVASPLAAYKGSPALLCNTQDDWTKGLERLISDWRYRRELGEKGQAFVRDHFTKGPIIRKYLDFFSQVMQES